jgi:YidC/Oxa1 family membrane protein insertase
MQHIWMTIFYQPLYNALIFFVNILPEHSIGLAVILLTILVKVILLPIAKKSIRSQLALKAVEPELERIKRDFPNKEEQAKQTFALYKEKKINPFSGCLLLLIQIPVILALYQVFIRGADSSTGVLYSFVGHPGTINTMLFGISMASKSVVLAILSGLTQFIQAYIMNNFPKKVKTVVAKDEKKDYKTEFAKSMQFQMQYVLPIFIAFVAYQVSAAVALYWVTSNIFTIVQEYVMRRKYQKTL